MSTPSHTPGPWHVLNHSMQCIIRSENFEETFTNIAVTPGLNGNAEANARLIAAAPDLLEACKSALDEGDDYVAMKKLKAAIAKAEGSALAA